VYDHVEPSGRAGVLEEEPLLVRISPLDATVRLAHRAHDLPKVPSKVSVVGLDVPPPLLSEDDAAAVRVERRGKHGEIVAGVVRFDNALFRTRL
jgi:hypothetical protein